MSVNVIPEESSEASEAFSCPNCSSAEFHLEFHCSRCGWISDEQFDIHDFSQSSKWKRILNADVITLIAVLGFMNFMWLRLCCQTAGIEISLLQNLLYAVPFTLLFLLPAAAFRSFLDALAPRQQKQIFPFRLITNHHNHQKENHHA